MSKQRFLLACATSAVALAGLMASASAEAQVGGDANPAGTTQQGTLNAETPVQDGPDIVVTGSLIAGTPEDSAVPVDVISGDELVRQGSPSAIELLKNLPTSNGVVGDANQFDSRSQSSEGTASVNLRGLGPQRTLVLLNGKRIVSSAGSGIPFVDVNLIPAGAIGRIEVLKDGAAATYGSDAITGVVNFITRTDQRGFLASGDYRRIPGSKGDYGGNVSYGTRGEGFNLFASFGYQHRSELRTTDRDFTVQPYANNPQGGWTGGGNPGNFDFNATVPFVDPTGRLFTGFGANGAATGVNFIRDLGCESLGGFRSLPGSTAQTATVGGVVNTANDRCFSNYGQFGNLVEPEDRYQAYMQAEVDLADNARLNMTALLGSSSTRITTSPTYLPTLPPSANAASGGSGFFQIPTYAPALRDYCATYGANAGCTTTPAGAPLAPALAFPVLFRPALLGGNPVFLDDQNDRGSAFSARTSETIRFTADLSIDVTDKLNLATGFTFSQYIRNFEGTDTFGDLLQNALAGFGGANCAYASTASRAGLTPAQLAALAGTNGCTFFNPFSTAIAVNPVTGQANANFAGGRTLGAGLSAAPGAGLVNDIGTFDNFFRTTRTTADTQLFVGDVVLSGRSGIQLPGGELAFAIGGQYRKDYYTRLYNADSNLANNPCPGTPLNPAATCNPQTGALGFLGTNFNGLAEQDVYAIFAELQLPLFDALNLQLSARYEDYGGAVGSTFDPQARAKLKLTNWLAIRGGAGTTFRGPPAQQLEGNLTALQIIGTSFRAVDINGNAALEPESATTYNGGVLIEGGGLNLSVDYFRYELKGPLESEPVQGIVNALFGATGAANCNNAAFAALQARFTFTAAGCGIANVQRLRTQVVNSANVQTSGLDIQGSYRGELGPVNLVVGGNATYIIDYETDDLLVEGILVQPRFDGVGLLNYQTTAYPLPEWKGNWYVQGDYGASSLRLQFNYIDGYTDQRGAAIFGPNLGALAGASTVAGRQIGSFRTMDATYRLTLNTGTTIALSALNIFDRDPSFARLDQNYDPFTGNPLGLTAKIGVSQRF